MRIHAHRPRPSRADAPTLGLTSPRGDALAATAAQLRAAPAVQRLAALGAHLNARSSGAPRSDRLPAPLKAGVEALSGLSMDDVRVHRNSARPAQLQAHAYAQGTDIHLGPGQERHLPHEAWHVVQQKQGRVRPNGRVGGVAVNDEAALEAEADKFAASSSPMPRDMGVAPRQVGASPVLQPIWIQTAAKQWHWDKLLTGVMWFTDGQLMWYEVREESAAAFQPFAGRDNARPEGEWLRLGVTHVPPEDEVYTDSESDSEDPRLEGFRLTSKQKKGDLAEFDRVRFNKAKLYEDKTADFSRIPQAHQKPIEQMVAAFIKKQVTDGISKKINAIVSIQDLSNFGIRDDKTGLDKDESELLSWLTSGPAIKVVVAGEGEALGEQLAAAIQALRSKFPKWKITAALGDKRAREDHDKMHVKK